ncbi:glycosyltransferase [Rummeliibacillus suwonensis]|uniref:glycosyltransferase n=1 Tax=Rummeliibacillus suwonensis TaxID=1306154 RepID=UPI0011B4E053|nr:glycosyltransferase [Rummeliibacillus suwonensis]
MKKILQINSVCGIGSTGRIATDIHQLLLEQGYDSYIAYGRDSTIQDEKIIRIGTKYDNYAHVALTRIYDQHGFGSKKATKDFIKKVEKLNPDIIHLHNIHGYYINIEMLFDYLKEANKPVIWTLHDCWAITGHCAHFDYIQCRKWQTGCGYCPQTSSYPSSYIYDNSSENYIKKQETFTGVKSLTIATPSKWLANLVKDSFLGAYPIKVINNGIDLAAFKPTKSDFRKTFNLEDKFIILGVANVWNAKKGFDYFIELSKRISLNTVIVLVGLTPKQMEKLPKNIIGIRNTRNVQELAKIYSAADVFVNPTLEEVMGTTNIEALACGIPVITFDAGGCSENLNDQCGIVVEKENMDALNKAIETVYNNGKPLYMHHCIKRAKLYKKEDRFNEYISTYTNVT